MPLCLSLNGLKFEQLFVFSVTLTDSYFLSIFLFLEEKMNRWKTFERYKFL